MARTRCWRQWDIWREWTDSPRYWMRLRARESGLPVIPVEMMVLKQFSNRRLDELLAEPGESQGAKIALKASADRTQQRLDLYHLYEELKEGHEAMAAGNGQ